MKEQILQLREQGKTYDEIKEQLGCSKGTIAYHCGEGQKLKTKEANDRRREKNRQWLEDLKSQYTDKHRDLMRMQLETEILERTAVYGLKIPDKQPFYIVDKVYDDVIEK